MEWNRNVAIVGIGRTPARTRIPEMTQLDLVKAAMDSALEDAGLNFRDIDIGLVGDMELFQGDYQSDMWHSAGLGAYLKESIRMTTGGTTGGMLVTSGLNFVASGMHDIAICIGWQKHDEGNATTGLSSAEESTWMTWTGAGVAAGLAKEWTDKFGERAELASAEIRRQMSLNASKNPYAHLRKELTIDEIQSSPILADPMRLLHLCPQSSGACALILAPEERAGEITDKPVWIRDYVVSHWEEMDVNVRWGRCFGAETTYADAARKLYERNGITDPRKEIDLFEMYNPSSWLHMWQLKEFLHLTDEELLEMVESGENNLDGSFPVCPSGGVMATNPIGATAMLRVAEAALQIRGDGGECQVTKNVDRTMASSFGGVYWTILHLLSKHLD